MTARPYAVSDRLKASIKQRNRLAFTWIGLSVFLVKLLFLLLDHNPGFHFGDSGAYLATALMKWIPPDRSFTYGFLIRPFISFHSLLPLLILQTAMSALASTITGVLLYNFCGTSLRISMAIALLSAIEPLQLMSERYVMVEAAGTFGFALFTLVCFCYLRSKSLFILFLGQVLGVLLVSLRISFLPLVLLLSIALPVLAEVSRAGVAIRPLIVYLLTAILVSQTLLWGYRHLYGFLAETKPAYMSRDGYFLAADMAPIIKPADFPIPGKRPQLFRSVTIPLSGIDHRRLHRWLPGGLCAAILNVAGGNEEVANRIARETAIRAMNRDPLGVISLAFQTYRQFFEYRKVEWALKIDQGKFVEPTVNDVAMIEKWFGIDVSERRFHSLSQRWEASAAPWCWFMLLLPFGYALEVGINHRRVLRSDYLLLLMSFTILFAAIVPVEIANPRYLVPLPWLSILIVGTIYSRLNSSSFNLHMEHRQ